MAKPTYYEMLLDPRWQKMRLEVMERDKFTCRRCDDTKSTINVHHTYYEKGFAPWDYPAHSLWTLCKSCHSRVQEQMKFLQRAIGRVPIDRINVLMGFADAMYMDINPDAEFSLENCEGIDPWMIGVAKYFRIAREDVAMYSTVSSDGETEVVRGADCLQAVAERSEAEEVLRG